MKINQYEFLRDKPIIETNRETGTMKIDDNVPCSIIEQIKGDEQ